MYILTKLFLNIYLPYKINGLNRNFEKTCENSPAEEDGLGAQIPAFQGLEHNTN